MAEERDNLALEYVSSLLKSLEVAEIARGERATNMHCST
jgi:hypothetical protein